MTVCSLTVLPFAGPFWGAAAKRKGARATARMRPKRSGGAPGGAGPHAMSLDLNRGTALPVALCSVERPAPQMARALVRTRRNRQAPSG